MGVYSGDGEIWTDVPDDAEPYSTGWEPLGALGTRVQHALMEEEQLMEAPQEAAAMWGLAENVAMPVADRLACALKALKFYGEAYEKEGEA